MGCADSVEVPLEGLKLIVPFSMIIAGPSQSGKNEFLYTLLNNLQSCINEKFDNIIFIYGAWQERYKSFPNIFFTNKIEYLTTRPSGRTLLICDDVMSKVNNSSALEDLFTRGRHQNVSTILILQSLFYAGKIMKTLRNNVCYVSITQHLQDIQRLTTFAAQLERKNSTYFIESYDDAMREKYNYLFIDLHPKSVLRDAPYYIKYRSKVHKPHKQDLYIDKKRYREE